MKSTGRSSRSGLTPHARRATVSRSPDSRPNAIRSPARKAIGSVSPSACGRSVSSRNPTVADRDAFGQQDLGLFEHRPDGEDEGEEAERQQKWPDGFAD